MFFGEAKFPEENALCFPGGYDIFVDYLGSLTENVKDEPGELEKSK